MTTERDVQMGRTITAVKLRGMSACDARIVERRLKTELVPVLPRLHAFDNRHEWVLRAGSQLEFTVLNTEECTKNSGSYTIYKGKSYFGPMYFLDIPFDNGHFVEQRTTLSYYDGLTVVK